VSNIVARLKRSAPAILTFVGAVGVVATAVMAVRETPKAVRLLGKAKEQKGGDLTKLETAKIAAPVYIPAIAVGVSAIVCIFGANVLNKRSQASLASAYGLLSQSYKRYKDSTKAVYGDDADSRIKAQAAESTYVSAGGMSLYSEALDPESERVLCYDMFSQRYFTATMASVLNAQYHINRNLSLRGSVNVNEFYGFLGIDKVDYGCEIGWEMDKLMEYGLLWLDFDNTRAKMEDGMECVVIDCGILPDRLEYL
jgi:hypothetical protein